MTRDEINKEQLKLKIKALKGTCKKQGAKIKNQKREISILNKQLIHYQMTLVNVSKKHEDINKYINRLLDTQRKLDLDAILITIKFMLLDSEEDK